MDSLIFISNRNETIKPNIVIDISNGRFLISQTGSRQKYKYLPNNNINLVAKPRIELGFSASETLVLTIVRQGHGIKLVHSSKFQEPSTVEIIL